ncbi:glycosyltransferase family 2 protein [Evansella sp. AB-rgal1]|uniref:glycosyltransferase family 2 protein n=1 Tax=Evansella sp. AB-rgal1 TaxID=3242696 RepID=UPI00359CDCE3
MKTSVIIPTYKRTNDLKRCLDSLNNQTMLPDEVVVVMRDVDVETLNFMKDYVPKKYYITEAYVSIPGQVAALNQGLEISKGNIVCILDDDTAPRPYWLERIVARFSESEDIGGVGGRDWVHHGDKVEAGMKRIVGKVQWFGRVIGNHHLGYGEVRDVDVLKGANMSYRRTAIEGLWFDERLLGKGAQVHNDMAFSLSVRKKGWRLVYDPEAAVDHYPAQRFDSDQRGSFNEEAYYFGVYNETLIMSEYYSSFGRRFMFVMWSILIGTSDRPGIVQLFRLLLKKQHYIYKKFLINFKTKFFTQRKRKKALLS